MDREKAGKILEDVASGKMKPEDALKYISEEPYTDLGYAKIDDHREFRQGVGEVVYGAGKTLEQIEGIVDHMVKKGAGCILITRTDGKTAGVLGEKYETEYNEQARALLVGHRPEPDTEEKIVIVTGGTSDIPVAEEAAFTAECFGNPVVKIYDAGVAGLHRLLDRMDDLYDANVVIAAAGMEGALASVVGGLVDCPVIAVPTSVGYGSSFEGLAALLSMLNSCAGGISVVNIDNGFGAGYLASKINHMGGKKR